MAKDFATTVKFMCEPVIDGIINPCYGDGYFRIDAEKRFGKERLNKAIREYRERHSHFDNWRY